MYPLLDITVEVLVRIAFRRVLRQVEHLDQPDSTAASRVAKSAARLDLDAPLATVGQHQHDERDDGLQSTSTCALALASIVLEK